jgi:catechol 2,3-dioxygenase-like lactoylglutathione lyase family enzyme
MLHHVSIGVSDVGRAAQFYDSVLATLGYRRVMEFLPFAVAYGEGGPEFWVQMPQDQQAPSSGNGAHIAFTAQNKKHVDAFHAAALGAGAKDEGAPGPRPEYTENYYGAFVRDLFGNKIEAVFLPMPDASQPKTKAAPKRKTKSAKKDPARRRSAAKKRASRKPAGRKTGARRATARRAKKR